MTDSLIIIGAGGHGKSIYEVAASSGKFSRIAYLDDSWIPNDEERSLIIGLVEDLAKYSTIFSHAIIGIGNNKVRENLQQQVSDAGLKLVTLIHPHACVSPSAKIGNGVVIFAGTVLGVDVKIGDGVIVNCSCAIDHDSKLGDYSHLGVGVNLAGNSDIGRSAFIQAGSSGGYNTYVEPYAICTPGSVLKTRA
ncbi:PglD-related sugar-binding protein [Rahnella variigena]|uniref:PglD-related sugar-binding protein n=1 Tax=Rahnella variigena TaxID=574964 RepID=UPI00132F6045|nr:sugar O-acyltransferase [Rahnella variigena]